MHRSPRWSGEKPSAIPASENRASAEMRELNLFDERRKRVMTAGTPIGSQNEADNQRGSRMTSPSPWR